MNPNPAFISSAAFRRVSRAYRDEWGLPLLAARPDGAVVLGRPPGGQDEPGRLARQHAIAEALRWGEPTVCEYPGRRLVWAVPVMHNAELIGGLLTIVAERDVFSRRQNRLLISSRERKLAGASRPRASARGSERNGPKLGAVFPVRKAAESLRLLAERENLTNAALLAERREEYRRQQKRAEAIQDLKTRYFYSIREVYLREEPELISAVRQSDRQRARGILNRILVEIYALGSDNLTLIKSFLMELVVTMCRTAVECGGDPRELLGANYASISELSAIDGEEELSHWLVRMLERIMDSIAGSSGTFSRRARPADGRGGGPAGGSRQPSIVLLQSAMKHLADHFDEPITRDELARVAGLSPPHFSRLIRQKSGRGFTDLLNQLRIDRAVQLLRHTDKGLLQIAIEVGYNDQSYFTKVFRRYLGVTPRKYRLQHQA